MPRLESLPSLEYAPAVQPERLEQTMPLAEQ
jgi:hypothetical protein